MQHERIHRLNDSAAKPKQRDGKHSYLDRIISNNPGCSTGVMPCLDTASGQC